MTSTPEPPQTAAALDPRPIAAEPGLLGPAVTAGFAIAVGVWSAWFITHLPWLGIPERVSIPVLLAVWVMMAAVGPRIAGVAGLPGAGGRWWARGALAGAISAVLGLLILGSKLKQPAADGTGAGALVPNTGAIALGFLALGTIIGLAGAGLALALPRSRREGGAGWMPRLAIVAVVAAAPLLFIGGLVTSTNSGMAVPDWPNTYGSNMFLYPLGPRAGAAVGEHYEKIYLEHSHRLFGSLLGLASLALMIGVLRLDERRWVRRWAVAIFALVCVQGILGGVRVLSGDAEIARDNRFFAMLHGVLAQVVFAGLVALAVFVTPAYRALRGGGADAAPPEGDATWPQRRRLRGLATGAAHATLMQLVFGAMYRHFRSSHALWTHAGFSIIVVLLAVAAGFAAQGLRARAGRGHHAYDVMGKVGTGVVAVVGLQFLLGWVAFAVGGRGHEAESVVQALIRTVHQANGALLLALATVLYMWSRAMAPRRPAAEAAVAPAAA
jgi:cytochrome c oxidase assembly protein subunit 15